MWERQLNGVRPGKKGKKEKHGTRYGEYLNRAMDESLGTGLHMVRQLYPNQITRLNGLDREGRSEETNRDRHPPC